MSEAQEYHLTATEPQTALDLLKTELSLSTSELKRLAEAGCVWWQTEQRKPSRIRRLKKTIAQGDQIHCYYHPDVLQQSVIPAHCLADEAEFSIWLKPRGMFSQPTKWGDANSIARFVEQTLDRPTWLVHRLDRMTTGLMILSHKKTLVAEFEKMLRQQRTQKSYVAVVSGEISETPQTITEPLAGKPSHTEITEAVYGSESDLSLVAITIETGRKHQIRQHLAMLSHPVLGDRLYGDNRNSEVDLQLVARALRFNMPGEETPRNYQLPVEQLQTLLVKEVSGLVDTMFTDQGLK